GVRETGNNNNSALRRRRPTALNASAFDVGPGGRARLTRANPATTAKGNTRRLCSRRPIASCSALLGGGAEWLAEWLVMNRLLAFPLSLLAVISTIDVSDRVLN